MKSPDNFGTPSYSSDSKPEEKMSEILFVSVVDDDESVRLAMGRLIQSFGFTVVVFASAAEFLASGHLRDTACLILDMHMPRMNGLQLQAYLAQAGCLMPIIFITAYPDEKVRSQALQAGATCFLEKPFSDATLLNGIRQALRLDAADGLPR
jgi:FixJ family two-component response regulator